MISNLLPYSGCKIELLPHILKLIPTVGITKINDVFGGSGCFALNAADFFPFVDVFYNEFDKNVFHILEDIKEHSPQYIHSYIETNIKYRGLNSTDEQPYLAFRQHVNDNRDRLPSGLADLLLTRHAFSSTCRWSKKTGFNMPFGFRTWNYDSFWQSQAEITHELLNNRITMCNESFDYFFECSPATPSTFDYIDPPYLITKAVYNHGWREDSERLLYKCIDDRVEDGVRFVLSNVISHKGIHNHILMDWMTKYNVLYVDKNYRIGRTSNADNKTVEVIVTNLPIQDELASLEDFLY